MSVLHRAGIALFTVFMLTACQAGKTPQNDSVAEQPQAAVSADPVETALQESSHVNKIMSNTNKRLETLHEELLVMTTRIKEIPVRKHATRDDMEEVLVSIVEARRILKRCIKLIQTSVRAQIGLCKKKRAAAIEFLAQADAVSKESPETSLNGFALLREKILRGIAKDVTSQADLILLMAKVQLRQIKSSTRQLAEFEKLEISLQKKLRKRKKPRK